MIPGRQSGIVTFSRNPLRRRVEHQQNQTWVYECLFSFSDDPIFHSTVDAIERLLMQTVDSVYNLIGDNVNAFRLDYRRVSE